MGHVRTFTRLSKLAAKSGVRVGFKDQSATMKKIATLLFFRPDFMTETVTVWGGVLYFPTAHWAKLHPEAAWRALAHSLVHVSDQQRVTVPVYALTYLFPQCLSVLAFLAVLDLRALLFLLFLLPWPAPFRKHWEMRAYAMTLATEVWSKHDVTEIPDEIVQAFTGRHGYWMWPFPTSVRSELRDWVVKIKAKRLGLFLPYTDDVRFSAHKEGPFR